MKLNKARPQLVEAKIQGTQVCPQAIADVIRHQGAPLGGSCRTGRGTGAICSGRPSAGVGGHQRRPGCVS